MNQHMCIKTPNMRKRLLTKTARMRFLPRVHLQMRLQRRLRHKPLPAITTQKRLLAMRQQMCLQQMFRLVRPLAYLTDVFACFFYF